MATTMARGDGRGQPPHRRRSGPRSGPWSGPRSGTWSDLSDAVLVRIRVGRSRDWPRRLPVVPDGNELTVSVSHHSLAAVPAETIAGTGYRLVGVVVRSPDPGVPQVDVLVPRAMLRESDGFREQLLAVAERVFNPAHGPVRAVLGPVLERHLATPDP